MTADARPYIQSCAFCGDGLLRFFRCHNCDEIVAICDECELMWEDIAGLSDDSNLSSDSSFPECPACGASEPKWSAASIEELEERDLAKFADGESV